MSSKFYIISLGPGNPELITIQAVKAINECDIIYVQTRSKELTWKGSVSYRIIQKIINSSSDWFGKACNINLKETWQSKFCPIYTPMRYVQQAWDDQIEKIIQSYNNSKCVGYVTLGDAAVHSSAYYLLEFIKLRAPEIYENTEIIPGVTSYSYASSRVKKPLCVGDMSLEVIPRFIDESKVTKVYMRGHKGEDLTKLKGNDLHYFKNLGFENEEYGEGAPETIDNYLTLIIDFAKVETNSISEKEE